MLNFKLRKGEIATLLTLGLVLVGTLITLGTSLFVSNKKTNLASNSRAEQVPCKINQKNCTEICGNTASCSSSCTKKYNVPDEGIADRVCINTNSSSGNTTSSISSPEGCGSGEAYSCPVPHEKCKDKKGLEFGCYVKSTGAWYGCIGTPCNKVTSYALVTEAENIAISSVPGYVPQCKAGAYVAVKDCENACGKGYCQKCKLGSYTEKYECKVSTTDLPLCVSETFDSEANCKNKYGKDAKCTQCLVEIMVRYELSGPGPTQGAFPTPTSPAGQLDKCQAVSINCLNNSQSVYSKKPTASSLGGPIMGYYNGGNCSGQLLKNEREAKELACSGSTLIGGEGTNCTDADYIELVDTSCGANNWCGPKQRKYKKLSTNECIPTSNVNSDFKCKNDSSCNSNPPASENCTTLTCPINFSGEYYKRGIYYYKDKKTCESSFWYSSGLGEPTVQKQVCKIISTLIPTPTRKQEGLSYKGVVTILNKKNLTLKNVKVKFSWSPITNSLGEIEPNGLRGFDYSYIANAFAGTSRTLYTSYEINDQKYIVSGVLNLGMDLVISIE